ncbi:MAG: hypothetical protein ABF714_03465 [Novacetimonas hansenii]|uniref:hypothetical protein n=1 Tax=Novacetimonas hansenii TaxID=436 RepID=UPI0039EC8AA5
MSGISRFLPKRAGISPDLPARAGVSGNLPTHAGAPGDRGERHRMCADAMCNEFQDLVNAEVAARRDRLGLRAAFAEGARTLGFTARRVRACWHHEVRAVTLLEWQAVRDLGARRLAQEERRLQREDALIRQRLEAIRQRQAALRDLL